MVDERRLIVLFIAIILLLNASSTSAQDDVVVRAKTNPAESAWVGQRIDLQIDVLAKDLWANLPTLPRVDVPGAVVYTPPSQSLRLTEQIGGESYTGQQYEFWIYPQRKGKLRVPSLNLDVQVKSFGTNSETTATSAKTEAISLDVAYPESAGGSSALLCVENLSAKQTWDPPSGDFRVGDGLTRTITRTVDGAPGMLLNPVALNPIDGVRSYPKQPEIDDRLNRGALTGTRTEIVTYVFEKAGNVEIPAVDCLWWNVASDKLQTAQLPGITLEVAAAEVPDSELTTIATDSTTKIDKRLYAILLVLSGLGVLAFWGRKRLADLLDRYRTKYRDSELAHFRRFLSAAKTGRPDETLRALVQWWDVADRQSKAPRLDLFFQQFGDAQTTAQVETLEAAVDSRNASWDGKDFVNRVRGARKRWRAARHDRKALQESPLPPLYC